MNWTASELRQLRYRLGWSRAEMARHLACDTMTILAFEIGEQSPEGNSRKKLIEILQTAESCRARVQRRAMAEVIMRDRGLQQIHDTDLTACLDEAFKKNI